MNNQIAVKLNKACKYAFMQLHNAFGFDFEKPFEMVYHEGNFTIASARKMLGVPYEDFIIIIRNPGNYCHGDCYQVVKAIGGGFDLVEGKTLVYFGDWKKRLDYYFRKSDFNDDRKSTKAQAFFLYQAKEYRRPVKPVKKYGYYCSRNDDEYDKCGNNITERRNELRCRAEALRRERQRAAYLKTDDAAKVQELEKKFAATKAAIISELEKATTPDEFDRVGKKCEGWHGLRWIARSLETYKKRTAAWDYTSIDEANAAYNGIFSELEALTKDGETK